MTGLFLGILAGFCYAGAWWALLRYGGHGEVAGLILSPVLLVAGAVLVEMAP